VKSQGESAGRSQRARRARNQAARKREHTDKYADRAAQHKKEADCERR